MMLKIPKVSERPECIAFTITFIRSIHNNMCEYNMPICHRIIDYCCFIGVPNTMETAYKRLRNVSCAYHEYYEDDERKLMTSLSFD